MRLRADWAVVNGVLLANPLLVVDGHGVVREVHANAPARAHERRYENAVVIPGGTDACALATLLPEVAAFGGDVPQLFEALGELALGAPSYALQQRAEACMAAALCRGITTVALPHLAPQLQGGGGEHTADFDVADALIAASEATGVRLALLDTFTLRPGPHVVHDLGPAQQACSHPDFEAASAHLEALVHHILAQGSRRLSWGMLFARPSTVGADAFVAARLRLAHLPTLLLHAGERFASPHVPPSHAQATLLTQACASRALDACCSVVGDAASLAALDASVNAALAAAGTAWLQSPPPPHPAPPNPQTPSLRRGSASGVLAPTDVLGWTNATLASSAGRPPPSRVAASALGLVGGTLNVGTWADYAVLRPANNAPLPQQAKAVLAQLRGQVAAPSALTAAACYVAGRRVWTAEHGA